MSAFDMNKELFVALRAEICQSISKQHQIALGGYGLSAAIFGYIVSMSCPRWESLVVIPFVLLSMTSLWTVECNRMVRAGYFIGYFLWPALKDATHVTSNTNWETWIRSDNQHAKNFRRIQHHLQIFVVVVVPLVASVIALGIASYVLWKTSPYLFVFLALSCVCLWIYVVSAVRKVSNLRAMTFYCDEISAAIVNENGPNHDIEAVK